MASEIKNPVLHLTKEEIRYLKLWEPQLATFLHNPIEKSLRVAEKYIIRKTSNGITISGSFHVLSEIFGVNRLLSA